MTNVIPEKIGIIAGNGAYPRLLAESAKKQGVKFIFSVAFKGETDPVIERFSDEVRWLRLGQLDAMLSALAESGTHHAVMAGQITPTSLFRVRTDKAMLNLLRKLPHKNAETIFGAVGEELKSRGIHLLPASSFMQEYMPSKGTLTNRAPDEREKKDIELGIRAADATSGLDIGQTVVIKDGVILAVEAFEGTNEAIKRAARLGGKGIVIVKLAKLGHDMRFDIPVTGMHTMKLLRKVKAGTLAIEAGRSIILEREKVIDEANRIGVSITAVERRGSV